VPSTPYHAAFAALPRESIAVTFNWIQPGHPEVPPHDHPYDQLSRVVAGTLELELDPVAYRVAAGELLYIPAGVPHTGRVRGDEPVLNIDVFAPMRDDYLPLATHQPG
jgi:quercetin dioxygenase-like cupin family protein